MYVKTKTIQPMLDGQIFLTFCRLERGRQMIRYRNKRRFLIKSYFSSTNPIRVLYENAVRSRDSYRRCILRLKNTIVAAQTLTAISGDLIRVISIVIVTDVSHIFSNAKFCG